MTNINEQDIALEAIRKKLVGKKLNYRDIFAIMDEISQNRLGDILTTYFAASGYSKGFTNEELYFLTKAMVETGEILNFQGLVADKHSIGGVPGTRTTLIVVPIVAAAGFTIPKSSSRAITTPDGTADDMEILSKVAFSKEKLYEIVKKTGGCIVWGGSVNIAPADDILIHVEKPLLFESYDKIVVSIMAKKIAFGSNHVVIDIPFGKSVKVHRAEDAEVLKEKFLYVAKKFNIKVKVLIHETEEPAGRGIGPVLETRESLRVLEQASLRPLDLEARAVNLAGALLDLCLDDSNIALQEKIAKEYSNGRAWANSILKSGKALEKMKEIIKEQEGNPNVTSDSLSKEIGDYRESITSSQNGKVKEINSKNITIIAKILGAPHQKGAGIYLDRKLNETVKKEGILYTLYSQSMYNLKEAKESLKNLQIMRVS